MIKYVVATAKGRRIGLFVTCLSLVASVSQVAAQVELAPWGNVIGIRTQGQLLEFETSLRVVTANGRHMSATGKERQRPKYAREGTQQRVTTRLDSLDFVETVQDVGPGTASIHVQLTAAYHSAVAADGRLLPPGRWGHLW